MHKLELVRGSCRGSDLDLGDLVANLMGLWMVVDRLCLCCRCRLEEGMMWLELHDLELRGGRLGRLDRDRCCNGHRSRNLASV